MWERSEVTYKKILFLLFTFLLPFVIFTDPLQTENGPMKEEEENFNSEVINTLCCYDDIWQLAHGNFQIFDAYYEKASREPEYHQIHLGGILLLILDRDKFSVLRNFQMEIDVLIGEHTSKVYQKEYGEEYTYMRNLFGLPPTTSFEENLEEDLEYGEYPPIRRIIKTSPMGSKYVAKRPLPSNFADLVYRECVYNKNPYLLLSVFNFYLGYGDSTSFLLGSEDLIYNWNQLLGEARKEFLIHDLKDIFLYKEQALFFAEEMVPPHIFGKKGEKIYEGGGYMYSGAGIWLESLCKNLRENAHTLPPDPMGAHTLYSLYPLNKK